MILVLPFCHRPLRSIGPPSVFNRTTPDFTKISVQIFCHNVCTEITKKQDWGKFLYHKAYGICYIVEQTIQRGVCIMSSTNLLLKRFFEALTFLCLWGIRLPAGNRYLPGNRPHYPQLADSYQVIKFEQDLSPRLILAYGFELQLQAHTLVKQLISSYSQL